MPKIDLCMTSGSNVGGSCLFYDRQLNKYQIIYMRQYLGQFIRIFFLGGGAIFVTYALCGTRVLCTNRSKNEHLAAVNGPGKCPIKEFVSDLLNY